MKKAKYIFVLVLQLVVTYSIAQVTIKGAIVNSLNEGISFVSVFLLDNDSLIVKGGAADSLGYFELKNVEYGSYLFCTSSVTFGQVQLKKIKLDSLVRELDLGLLKVQNTQLLSEITVKANKPIITRKLNKLVANISGSIIAEGNTALEVLAYLPGVRIGAENEITVNGKGDVLVLIDGVGTRMNVEQIKTKLASFDGGSIDKIEVFTNPPARFDSQGSSVINIITKKDKMLSDVGLRAGHAFFQNGDSLGDAYTLRNNINLNYAFKQINAYAQISIWESKTQQRNIENTLYKGIQYERNSEGNFEAINRAFSSNTGAIWNINSRQKIIAEYSIIRSINNPLPTINSDQTIFAPFGANQIDSTLAQKRVGLRNYTNYTNGLGYFGENENGKISWDVQYNFSDKEDRNDEEFELKYITGHETTEIRETLNKYNLQSHSFQTNFRSDLISNKLNLSAGLKYTISTYDEAKRIDDLQNQFNYEESISATFFELEGKINKLSWNLGLRGENTNWRSISFLYPNGERSNEYLDFFPSVFAQYEISDDKSIGISYSRRIARPYFREFNPFLFYDGPFTNISGNVDALLPQYYDNLEANLFFKSIYCSLSFSNTKNRRNLIPIEVDGLVNSFQSISVKNEYIISGLISAPLFMGKVSVYNDLFVFYSNGALLEGGEVGSIGYSLSSNIEYKFLSSFKAGLNISYNSPNKVGYNNNSAYGGADLILSHSKRDSPFRLILRVNDLLGTKKWWMESNFPSLLSRSEVTSNERSITISLRYHFKLGNKFQKKRLETNKETSRTN